MLKSKWHSVVLGHVSNLTKCSLFFSFVISFRRARVEGLCEVRPSLSEALSTPASAFRRSICNSYLSFLCSHSTSSFNPPFRIVSTLDSISLSPTNPLLQWRMSIARDSCFSIQPHKPRVALALREADGPSLSKAGARFLLATSAFSSWCRRLTPSCSFFWAQPQARASFGFRKSCKTLGLSLRYNFSVRSRSFFCAHPHTRASRGSRESAYLRSNLTAKPSASPDAR